MSALNEDIFDTPPEKSTLPPKEVVEEKEEIKPVEETAPIEEKKPTKGKHKKKMSDERRAQLLENLKVGRERSKIKRQMTAAAKKIDKKNANKESEIQLKEKILKDLEDSKTHNQLNEEIADLKKKLKFIMEEKEKPKPKLEPIKEEKPKEEIKISPPLRPKSPIVPIPEPVVEKPKVRCYSVMRGYYYA